MYKISDKVINYMELSMGGKCLTEAKIQRGIFHWDPLSLLVLAMVPLNHILRKCIGGYELWKSQEKINHLLYMDDI